jgi:hypothetical protein
VPAVAVVPAQQDAPERPGLGVMLAFLAAGAVLGLLGRTAMVPGTDLAAVWPAAGVAVVWLVVRQAGPWSIHSAVLAGAMFVLARLSWDADVAVVVVAGRSLAADPGHRRADAPRPP